MLLHVSLYAILDTSNLHMKSAFECGVNMKLLDNGCGHCW